MTSDLDLLRQFARDNSQDAFAEIVRRHLNLVYFAALRQVRSPQLAEEIAQSVFADLARSAVSLARGGDASSPMNLTAWLYAVARRTAIDVIRKESRRQLREQIAVEMNNMNATTNDWTQIAPLLDDAMAALDETDRSAVLLRYFENKSLREVGENLNISDDAAQKRVSRAVERLREFFSKQKITIGAGGLIVLISANAVQSAPIGLVATISAAAVLTGTTVSTSTAIAATKAIAMTAIQKTLVAATLAVVAGTGIYKAHQASQLRNQVQMLQQLQTPLAAQILQLQRERDDATNKIAGLLAENAKLHASSSEMELMRLRGEVTQLQAKAKEVVQSKSATAKDAVAATADSWAKQANFFRQWFAENPDKSIPELSLLTDANWLFEASRNLQVFTNRSEGNDMHMIAYSLRTEAKEKFAIQMGHALSGYIAAHAGELPSELPQLLNYFANEGDVSPIDQPLGIAILQRYQLLHTGSVGEVPASEPIIREKAPVDDVEDCLMSIMIGSYSMQSTGQITDGMEQGQPTSWTSDDLKRIKPFLKSN